MMQWDHYENRNVKAWFVFSSLVEITKETKTFYILYISLLSYR